MTKIVLSIESPSTASAIRALVKNMIGVKIVSDSRTPAETSQKSGMTYKLCKGLEQVKMIQEGKLPRRTIQDMLDEI